MASIAANIEQLESTLGAAITEAGDEAALEAVRVGALGKKGSISELLRALGGMSPEQRQEFGPLINGLKTRVTDAMMCFCSAPVDQTSAARRAMSSGDGISSGL